MIARLLCLFVICSQFLRAFPPAPSATLHGKVRGTFGFGITDGLTDLLLLANGEEVSRVTISETGVFGENYRLTLPIDLNPAKGAYRIAAITPSSGVAYSFAAERNGVRIPISKVETVEVDPTPAAATIKKINFVLGEDSDGDGLPDDWERFQAGLLGPIEGDPLDLFSADGDYDKDGLSDRGEYIAGTFALLFEDGLNFRINKVRADRRTELSFLAIDGKSYRIESTTDFKTWTPVEFTLSDDFVNPQSVFTADNTLEQSVLAEPAAEGAKVIYRLLVD